MASASLHFIFYLGIMGEVTTKTICIQIGNSDNKLTQEMWHDFVMTVKRTIDTISDEVYFFGAPANFEKWQNVCWVVSVKSKYTGTLKEQISAHGSIYHQDSVAWLEGETQFI